MSKHRNITLSLLAVIFIAAGCDTLLDVDPDQVVFPDEHRLNSPDEIKYPMIGIFSRLDKLADSYILLGELRGDLMEVTENARPELKQIYDFSISRDNPYNHIEDFYAVINECNYLIRTIDTSIVLGAEKIMYREFAAAKAIRAWTYMQIALNYGTATYYEEPILDVDDAEQPWPEYTMDELAPVLIADLEPWKHIEHPEAISLGADLTSIISYFPIPFLLGNLYLWIGQYEQAAVEYNRLITNNLYTIDANYQSDWDVINGVFVEPNPDWWYLFQLNYNTGEQITLISGSTEIGKGSFLDSITFRNYEIAPSEASVKNWNEQVYYHNASAINQGDLRILGSCFTPSESSYIITLDVAGGEGTYISGLDIYEIVLDPSQPMYIAKYMNMTSAYSRAIYIYRSGLLYLRYAEAVNRAGKPNLAFAVLKHGMSQETLETDTIVPPHEKYINPSDSTLYAYMDFAEPSLDNNIGIHARGCGNMRFAADYKIPPLPSLEDSIAYVEDKIVEELALETAFEGNRFHDLMRVSLRRSDPSYLADRVAGKYPDGMKEDIRARLLITNNWYLPGE